MPTILLVDDEPAILTMLEGILAAPDRDFLLAGDARQAEELAAKALTIEVALVDKNLPDRNGLEVARALKRLHPDIEIILLTGYASLDSAIEAIQVGAFDYLCKPIQDFGDLSLKVQNAADKVRLKREQRSLLERYAESEERYRGVFQASSDALLVSDAESGKIQDANAAAESLYGYTRAELCALTIDELRASGAPAREGGTFAQEKHVGKDGRAFAVDVSWGQFFFHRQPTRIWSVRDISARARAEEERRALEEQVRHAQKMDAVGRLASGVAHDFNNLLTVILGNAELLLSQPGADAALTKERLLEVREAGKRAAALTRQLLAFSRKKSAHPVTLDLNAVVNDTLKMLRRMIGEHIELAVKPAAGLWRAKADADQLGQVLMNLAVNARDAMPQGGKLVIETANTTIDEHAVSQADLAPGRYVQLAVSDNGMGMSADTLKRIFEPFFTTKDPGKGTGLGLATVYGIARQAGGAVSAYSEEKVGTTFKVYLPATESSSAAAAAVKLAPPREGRGERVLIVEDDDAVRAVMRRGLQAHGYQTVEARNGDEGIAAAAGLASLDLLVTDVVMPQRSGKDLALALREKRPRLKVLFVSGYAEQATVELGHVDAGESFLPKPFPEEALLRRVAQLLDEEQTPARTAS